MPSSLSSVVVDPGRLELREFDLPQVTDDSGLLKVEMTGVCGTDVRNFPRPELPVRIMGHEIVGRIEQIGREAARRWRVGVGDRVLLEEYLPCGYCPACRSGEYRLCPQTDILLGPKAFRYGETGIDEPPALWGGFGQYVYLHPQTVLHRVDERIESRYAPLALPLSNGYEWAYLQGGVGPGTNVAVIGPGQQGLSCVLAAKMAGAGHIIVAGLGKDRARLDLAFSLGADRCVNVEEENFSKVVEEVTDGRMADLALDCAAASGETVNMAIDSLGMGGTFILGARRDTPIEVEFGRIRAKTITVKGVRGHSYDALDWALGALVTKPDDAKKFSSGFFPLADLETALAVTRDGSAIHVSVDPWA